MKALALCFAATAIAIVALIAWAAAHEGFFYPHGLLPILASRWQACG